MSRARAGESLRHTSMWEASQHWLKRLPNRRSSLPPPCGRPCSMEATSASRRSRVRSRSGRSGHPRHADDDLRHRPAHRPRRVPGEAGPGHRPRAGRRHRGARRRASTGYEVGDRVLVGAITPCGQCRACLSGHLSQCGHGGGYEAIGGWRFGNTINGAQAEYLLVPNAQANLAKIPDELTRRAGRPARRHRLDRLQRRRVGRRPDRRRGRRLRAGADRPVRDRRREADGRVARHRRRRRRRTASRWRGGWAPTSCSTTAASTSSPRSSA